MSSLAEAIRTLSVSATSPMGWVKVTVSEGRTVVEVVGRGSGAAPERELAGEATAAWCQALRRERIARERLRVSIRGEATREPVPEIADRVRERRAAVEAIEVSAESPGGVVRVTRVGSVTGEIRVRPGSMTYMDDAALGREIGAAIAESSRARALARAALTT